MSLELSPIHTVDSLDPQTFRRDFLKPRRPVIMRDLSKQWPAREKWTFNYLKQLAGDQVVGLYDSSKADASKKVNEPIKRMRFGDYLDLIASEPTELRIFTLSVTELIPTLKKDYANPAYCKIFLDSFPMMFFGGAGSSVFMHYDIDHPHLFHTQFIGKKRVLLVGPDQSPRMYKLPLSWHAIEDIKWYNPDFDRFPALRGVKAQTAVLNHGDTLFMPSGWWHYMEYMQGGFAISLRALPALPDFANGMWNVFIIRIIDNLLRKYVGPKWFDYKEASAARNSNRYAQRHPVSPSAA